MNRDELRLIEAVVLLSAVVGALGGLLLDVVRRRR
jgi:hypothetical protein